LHDIADNTTKEDEINDYLYTKNYENNGRDFDIKKTNYSSCNKTKIPF
jgi:hypothetical protein